MEKHRNMEVSSARDKTEVTELIMTINKIKQEEVRRFNMMKMNEALISSTSKKIVKEKL